MTKKKRRKTVIQKKETKSYSKFFQEKPIWSFVIVAFLLLLILFNQVMLNDRTFMSPDKRTSLAIGQFVYDALDRGIFPLWCPYIFSGMPSFGSLVSASKINIIDSTIRSLMEGPDAIFPVPNFTFIFLNYLLLGLFMYILMKSLKTNRLIAAMVGLATICMPQFIAFTSYGHNTKFLSLVLIPVIFLSTRMMFRKQTIPYFCLTSFAIGFQLIRAHVQVSYYTMIFLGIYFIYYVITRWKEDKNTTHLVKSGALLAGSIVLGVLLSAALYSSVLDYQQYSIRGSSEGTGLDYGYAASWSFHPLEMITFIIPSFMGFGGQTYWGKMPFTDYPLYFSVVILFLSGMAFILSDKKIKWFFAIVAAFSLVVSFGKHLPVLYGPMYKWLPFFNKFRIPSMIHILLDFSMVILAGLGLQGLIDYYHQQKEKSSVVQQKLKRYLYISLGLVGGVFIIMLIGKSLYTELVASARPNMDMVQRNLVYDNALLDTLKTLTFLSIAVFLVLQLLRNKVSVAFLVLSLIAITVMDLFLVNFKIIRTYPKTNTESYFEETKAVSYIKQDKELFRIFPVMDEKGANWYVYHFMQNILGYSAAKLRIYQDFLEESGFNSQDQYGINNFLSKYWKLTVRENRIVPIKVPVDKIDPARLNFENAMLDMLNVKYLISSQLPIEDSRFDLVQAEQPFVYENTTVLPRTFFVDSLMTLKGRDAIFTEMKKGSFDPRKYAIIEDRALFNIGSSDENSSKVTHYDLHEIKIEATVAEPALMVLSEVYYPAGWRAYVDGKETKIYKTNYFLRSIFLKPGEHEITFKFSPRSFKLGVWTSLATLGLLLILIAPTIMRFIRGLKR